MDVGHFGPTFTSSVYAVCPLDSGLGMGMMKMMDPLRRKCVRCIVLLRKIIV